MVLAVCLGRKLPDNLEYQVGVGRIPWGPTGARIVGVEVFAIQVCAFKVMFQFKRRRGLFDQSHPLGLNKIPDLQAIEVDASRNDLPCHVTTPPNDFISARCNDVTVEQHIH